MTRQIPNYVFFHGERFLIIGFPINLVNYLQISPNSATTACHRGYVAEYLIDKFLFLENLFIRTSIPALINEVLPINLKFAPQNTYSYYEIELMKLFSHKYERIHISIPYSGELFIGKEYIPIKCLSRPEVPRYVYYKTVFQFEILRGKIILEKELSEDCQKKREKIEKTNSKPHLT